MVRACLFWVLFDFEFRKGQESLGSIGFLLPICCVAYLTLTFEYLESRTRMSKTSICMCVCAVPLAVSLENLHSNHHKTATIEVYHLRSGSISQRS